MKKSEVVNCLVLQYAHVLTLVRNCGEDDAVAQNCIMVISNIVNTLACQKEVGKALVLYIKKKGTQVQKDNLQMLSWYFPAEIRNIIE